MALSYKFGAVQWLSADPINTTYPVSGLGFQPKALRFSWHGLQSATNATSSSAAGRRGMGFATSASDRRAVGTTDDNGAATTACASYYRTDCIAVLGTPPRPSTGSSISPRSTATGSR